MKVTTSIGAIFEAQTISERYRGIPTLFLSGAIAGLVLGWYPLHRVMENI